MNTGFTLIFILLGTVSTIALVVIACVLNDIYKDIINRIK